jgi:trehalose 6-phosphate synthase
VLVLSRFAGAAEEMSDAIIVNPLDADEVAEALHFALNMPRAERKARHERLFELVCQTTASTYCRDFLAALSSMPVPEKIVFQRGEAKDHAS